MAQSDKKSVKSDETAAPQPLAGSVISPGETVSLHQPGEATPPKAAKAVTPQATPPEPNKTVTTKAEKPPAALEPKILPPSEPITVPPEPITSQAAPVDDVVTDANDSAADGVLSWTASEYMAHDKSGGWYVLLLLGAGIFAAAVYLLTKDMVSTGVVIVAAIILAVYASRKPQEQQYTLDAQGINIGSKHYDYDGFKSFAVATEGAFSSLVFMPLKRFAIPLTIYYAPADEERIVGLISNHLPMEEHRLDAIDHLLRRMRF